MPPLDTPPPVSGLSLLMVLAEQVEAAVAAPVTPDIGQQLRAQAIQALAALPDGNRDPKLIEQASRLVDEIVAAGWVDAPASSEAVADAAQAASQGWAGLLVSLLLAPAWQNPQLPAFESLALFLWRSVAVACFRLPRCLSVPGQATAIAECRVQRTRELARLARANPGSSSLRAAALALETAGDAGVLRSAGPAFCEFIRWRSQLRCALRGRQLVEPTPAFSREGRQLTVGVVAPGFGDTAELREVLGWAGNLDPKRFHVLLFAPGIPEESLAATLRSAGLEPRSLPEDLPAALHELISASLDVAWYATRAGDPADPSARLLQHRVAPLQLATDARGVTTGHPFADAFLATAAFAAHAGSQFTERCLQVAAPPFRPVTRLGQISATQTWTREALGIADGCTLFSSFAPFSLLTPEWATHIAELLRGSPSARLLLHSGAPEDEGQAGMDRVTGVLAPAFIQAGIDFGRLTVSNEKFSTISDLFALAGQADLHLDTFPIGDGEGCRVALEAGVPVLTLAGGGNAAGETAAALREWGLSGCVTDSPSQFVSCAQALVADPNALERLRADLRSSLAQTSAACDSVLRGEAVSQLLEHAFDLVCAGTFAGEGGQNPLSLEPMADFEAVVGEAGILLDSGLADDALASAARCVARAPQHPAARKTFYAAMIAADRAARAEAGLAEAARTGAGDLATWNLLAQARIRQGRRLEAVTALRVSIGLEPTNRATWALIDDLAKSGGHLELSQEIDQCIGTFTSEPVVTPERRRATKSLYFSPVGKAGKAFLAEMLNRLPAELFDVLVIAYDDTDFADLGDRVQVIRDRGLKWTLVKRHLPPAKVADYEYVFIWDDDIDPRNFDGGEFVQILRRNDLDMAQPSLTADSYSFHPITVAHGSPVGRLTNFVEIMIPVYSARIWPAFYRYIDPELSPLGWGLDFLPIGRKAIVDCMSVRHTRPGQSAKAGAENQFAVWSAKYQVTRPPIVAIRDLE